jgi:hypothetical protein
MGEEVLKAAERLAFTKAKLLTLLGGYRDDMDEAAVRGFQGIARDLAEIETTLALTRPSTPSEDDVERVARAIWRDGFQGDWDEAEIERQWGEWADERETAFSQARAALAAMSGVRVGRGA